MSLVGFKGKVSFLFFCCQIQIKACELEKLMHKRLTSDMPWVFMHQTADKNTASFHFFMMWENRSINRQLQRNKPSLYLKKKNSTRRQPDGVWQSSVGGSDVHIIVLLVRLTLQGRLLAGRLLHLQCRLAQSVLFDCGSRLRGQDDVLCEGRERQQGSLLSTETINEKERERENLQPLFGFLGDAAFRGEKCGRRRRYRDLWRELGDGGGDEKLWHVGWDSGADSAGVWKLQQVAAGILLLVWWTKTRWTLNQVTSTSSSSLVFIWFSPHILIRAAATFTKIICKVNICSPHNFMNLRFS